MRLLASSRRIAPAGTPVSVKVAAISRPVAASSGHALDAEGTREPAGGGLDIEDMNTIVIPEQTALNVPAGVPLRKPTSAACITGSLGDQV